MRTYAPCRFCNGLGKKPITPDQQAVYDALPGTSKAIADATGKTIMGVNNLLGALYTLRLVKRKQLGGPGHPKYWYKVEGATNAQVSNQ